MTVSACFIIAKAVVASFMHLDNDRYLDNEFGLAGSGASKEFDRAKHHPPQCVLCLR